MDDSDCGAGYSEVDEVDMMEVDVPERGVSVHSSSAETSIQTTGLPKRQMLVSIIPPTLSGKGAHPNEYEKLVEGSDDDRNKAESEGDEDTGSDGDDLEDSKLVRVTREIRANDYSLRYWVRFENGKEAEVRLSVISILGI